MHPSRVRWPSIYWLLLDTRPYFHERTPILLTKIILEGVLPWLTVGNCLCNSPASEWRGRQSSFLCKACKGWFYSRLTGRRIIQDANQAW